MDDAKTRSWSIAKAAKMVCALNGGEARREAGNPNLILTLPRSGEHCMQARTAVSLPTAFDMHHLSIEKEQDALSDSVLYFHRLLSVFPLQQPAFVSTSKR